MATRKAKTVNLDFFSASEASSAGSSATLLSGMFASGISQEEVQQARLIEIGRLQDNPYQPRFSIDQNGLQELAQVIKVQGFQGVLIAREHPDREGSYQLTAGHRRRNAAEIAGLDSLPVIVRELSDEEMATIAITENIQREDLTPLEEGKIFLLMAEEMGYKHEQIAREIGKNRGYVENRLRVVRAPEDVQALVRAKPDSLRAVSTIIKIKDETKRAEIIEQMLRGRLTADDLSGYLINSSPPTEARTETDEGGPEIKTSLIPEVEIRTRSRQSKALDVEIDDSVTLARVGNGKLNAILRNLLTYRELASNRVSISEQEMANLNGIIEVVNELYEKFLSAE